jgi:hypothetical protein
VIPIHVSTMVYVIRGLLLTLMIARVRAIAVSVSRGSMESIANSLTTIANIITIVRMEANVRTESAVVLMVFSLIVITNHLVMTSVLFARIFGSFLSIPRISL